MGMNVAQLGLMMAPPKSKGNLSLAHSRSEILVDCISLIPIYAVEICLHIWLMDLDKHILYMSQAD
jgi:hypothetical protein